MTLAQPPQQGPYLFFTAEDLPALRARSERAPYAACRDRILATAARICPDPIPPEPAPGPPTKRDANGYLDAYLQSHYDFQAAGHALLNYGQVLAFAYLLDGNSAYGDRARDWAKTVGGWTHWGPQADPQAQAAPTLTGLALLYDWLANRLDATEKDNIRRTLIQRAASHRENWSDVEGPSPGGSVAWLHASAAGLASLALLRDVPQAAAWAMHWAALFRDRILPASFGASGAYIEGTGWWDISALRSGLLFFDALKRCGGPDLFADAGLQAYPRFLLQSSRAADAATGPQSRSWARFLPPSPQHYRYVLLRLAAAYADPALTTAVGDGLDVPHGTPLDWFYHHLHRHPYERDRWYTATLAWDAATGRCTAGIDGETWTIETTDATCSLAHIDGLRFDGGGLRLRHLGMRAGEGPATALLERDTELTVGQRNDVTGPVLQAKGLHLRFPAASRGTVWFQVYKTGLEEDAAIHLQADGRDGPGLHLQAVGLFPAPGADFCLCHGVHPPWPPGAHPGGRVWFDGPWEYLWHENAPAAAAPPAPTSVHFPDAGLSLLRGQSADTEVELRFRAGPAWGRDRGDQNAFAISLGGQPLAGDLPQAASGQSHLSQHQFELDNFFLNTFAANTVLVDGQPQQRGRLDHQWGQRGTEAHSGRTTAFMATPLFDAVCGEAAKAYASLQGFRRRIAFVKPDYFVVVDHLLGPQTEAASPLSVDWLLHAPERLTTDDGIRLEAAGGALEVFLLHPDNAAAEYCQTPAPQRERTSYLRLPLEGPHPSLAAVLVPVGPGQRTPLRPEVLEGHGGLGIQLRRGNARDWLLCRDPLSPTAAAGGVRTDAEIAFLRRERDVAVLAALVGGSRLHWRAELAGADTPIDLVVQRSASRLRAWVQTRQPTHLHLLTGTRPRYVRLGQARLDAQAWSYTPQGRRLGLDLEAGTHQLDVALK